MPVQQAQTRNPFRIFYPIFGLMLGISAAIIAWYVTGDAPSVPNGRDGLLVWLTRNVNGFSGRELPAWQLQLAVGAVVFLLLVSVAAAVVGIFARRSKINVTRKQLLSERKTALLEHEAKRMRQREVKKQIARANKSLKDL